MNLFTQNNEFGTMPKNPQKYDMPDADIVLFEGFFDVNESEVLYKNLTEKIAWQQDQIKFYGKTMNIPRLTAWYGDEGKAYTYSRITMLPHAWAPDLLYIKNKIETVAKVQFSSVLLNLYRQGQDSMGWHSDDEKELGTNPTIASVSLGETRPFQLRHTTNKALKTTTIPLTTGSLLIMQGTTQHHWQHQIPKTSRQINPRINLTFRVIV